MPAPIPLQDRFLADALSNPRNRAILARWDALALPDGWLVAGCLFQAVWNRRAGASPEAQVKDYDLFFFDASDTSEAAERAVQARAEEVTADLGITVEASNQARVHLWYEAHFGHPYPAPLGSACDGIARFLVLETCVGMRPAAGGVEVCAPYGLEGLYAGSLSPNPRIGHPALFARKAASYRARWPMLQTSVV